MDDLLTKSLRAQDHISNLAKTFRTLREYHMKLNPVKCVFGVAAGKFLGFMVTERGIEANPDKIKALVEMKSPRNLKEIQKLTGKIASLNRFVSKATDRCLPFFQAIRKGKGANWTMECEEAFQKLKEYLGKAPILSKPQQGEALIVYLAATESAVSATLIRSDEGTQKPVYYVNKALTDAETRYPESDRVALALVTAARKLRPYFQAHPIIVVTSLPVAGYIDEARCFDKIAKMVSRVGRI